VLYDGQRADSRRRVDGTLTAAKTRHRLDLHRTMLRIRRFEKRASELYRDGEIPGFLHLSIGQEGVAAGVCSCLRATDAVVSTHRGHGHCLAKGVDMSGMFAELMGRESGTCHGRGGSMHIAELTAGVLGANGIVGAGLPIAAGAGAAFQLMGRDDIVVAFFGEGAVAQGAFHETVNLATLWRLPILFLCENNGFAEFSRIQQQQTRTPAERAAAYGLEGLVVDGNDVLAVEAAMAAILPDLRAGHGPRFLEALTLRGRGHYEGDQQRYRSQEEKTAWQDGDPVARSASAIKKAGGANELAGLAAEVEAEIDAALVTARSGPAPNPMEATLYTPTQRTRPPPVRRSATSTPCARRSPTSSRPIRRSGSLVSTSQPAAASSPSPKASQSASTAGSETRLSARRRSWVSGSGEGSPGLGRWSS